MRTRQQAETEQQDEPEEREEEIVYEVRENVDDLFEGYCEGTKVIVVAFKSIRKLSFERMKEAETTHCAKEDPLRKTCSETSEKERLDSWQRRSIS
jgi:hypothetical protein